MRECAHDAVLLGVRAHDCGVHGEVAALGMASHVERAVERRSSLLQVLLGRHLRGHGTLEGHVEIFLPAHECGIRPAESDVGAAIGQEEGHRCELLLSCLVERRPIPSDAHTAKARVRADREKQVAAALGIPAIAEHLLEALRPHELRDRSALPGRESRHVEQQAPGQAIVGEP